MEVGGDKAVTQLRQLSHSFNRAVRAVRQIMVLKEEAAGLRPTPHARVAANGNAANQNSRAGARTMRVETVPVGIGGPGATGAIWTIVRTRMRSRTLT
jgi:hypothetical protein